MLRDLRNRKDKSQAETALDMGVPRTAVSKIENGQRRLSMDEAARLVVAWELSDSEIVEFVRSYVEPSTVARAA